MKIFWSWQSDTPGKIGRHFVRDALKAAIDELKQPPVIEEPTARVSREELQLDQDRSGVPGSPDLARTILEKIAKAAVVVADVTPIGASADGKKKIMNPNVAIELGYALHSLSDTALLMVLNEHYGTREHLPFDLRHKAGPIIFQLAPDADKATIATERRRLTRTLVEALRLCLSATAPETPSAFPETPHKSSVAVYFDVGEHLASVGEPGFDETNFSYATTNGIYLRLIPTRRLPQPIPLSEISRLLTQNAHFLPLQRSFTDAFRSTNEYGMIICEPQGRNHLKASTQVFQNGEIWGFNAHLLTQRSQHGPVLIPSQAVEETFAEALRRYVGFARNALGIEPPYTVEGGLAGIEGAYVAMPVQFQGNWGPIRKPALTYRTVLNEPTACSAYLLNLFERMYDLTGHPRPPNLYGFPPAQDHD